MSLNIPKKISELPSTISLAPTDLFVRVGDGGVTSKLTLLKLQDYLDGNDTFVTGVTYTQSASTLTLTRNDGVSLSTTIVTSGNTDLSTVLSEGNTTSGNNIIMTESDDIIFKYAGFNNNINTQPLTTNRNINFPDNDGVVALTSDIVDTFVTGGTFNSGTNDIDFVGNSSFSPFSVSLNSFTPQTNLPACRIVISGTSGIVNTNNATDFLVPYNTVDVNTDPTIFNPNVTGGTGNQGKIQVLQSGRYYFTVRYSSFDLAQTGLPTVNGTVFLRITATKDTSPTGTAGGICVLDQSIVGTSVNGEATVVGGGIIDLAANDYLGVIGFHTGATGGSGSQGFPVTNNTFLNEPSFWMVKIG